METFLGANIESWAIGFFIIFFAFLVAMVIAFTHQYNLKRLQKYGKIITRKGTYTFTTHNRRETIK